MSVGAKCIVIGPVMWEFAPQKASVLASGSVQHCPLVCLEVGDLCYLFLAYASQTSQLVEAQ